MEFLCLLRLVLDLVQNTKTKPDSQLFCIVKSKTKKYEQKGMSMKLQLAERQILITNNITEHERYIRN